MTNASDGGKVEMAPGDWTVPMGTPHLCKPAQALRAASSPSLWTSGKMPKERIAYLLTGPGVGEEELEVSLGCRSSGAHLVY